MVPLWPEIRKNISLKSTIQTDYVSSYAGFFTFKIVCLTLCPFWVFFLFFFLSVNWQNKRTCISVLCFFRITIRFPGKGGFWAVGLLLHLQNPPDARYTCSKIEGPLGPQDVVQTLKKGLVDEKGTRRPGFWSCQCHPLTLELHSEPQSPHPSKQGWSHVPPPHRVTSFKSAREGRSALKNIQRIFLI